ncbi:imidazole glycerol phosphate synthase subunit HisH [Bradyrhizobium sp.]|jgi:glutamine amidotransferase|uniref:imidazole glycerol phosphate synthase subunit HisH n=1 Tax=Bradyrhizobium sp. TaxID=376 RepID=UPI002DFA725E|nr:imidazole glycerol phosphate synthase subunit HisH [Bradyrhizobium sp.]
MITIINYGLGNVQAFANLYKRLNIAAAIATSHSDFSAATKLILPGVGAFDHAMELLDASGMRETIDDLVLKQGMPVLGVCVGMQILAPSSEEGKLSGLGWIDGRVRRFDEKTLRQPPRLPHMGWNDVTPKSGARLFSGLEQDSRFYFLHSYYFDCASSENVLATSEYGIAFGCAVRSNNIYGVQFHPEKSHNYGVRLLKNFAEL